MVQFQRQHYASKNKYKQNCIFERRSRSSRKSKFDEFVMLIIIELVTNDLYNSIIDIEKDHQNNFSKANSIGCIYSILKGSGFSNIEPKFAPKSD